jgi:DNA-binding transcriptional LysR family regulator
MIAAARGYGISMGDLLMVAEDVAQRRLSLPWPTAVPSGLDYYLVWPRTRPGGERLGRLSLFLQQEAAAVDLPAVQVLSAQA